MEDWEYDELFNLINEYYQDFLALNRGHKYAIARTDEQPFIIHGEEAKEWLVNKASI